MFNFVVRIGWLDSKFKDQTIYFVDHKSHFNVLLKSMADDSFGANHELDLDNETYV